ncbi:MAG: ATP-binding cassette domain-containing protein [Asgard group archaeon]|nr:ATP-binding cassette domain-containing protein [Asgard group archaeon]
MIECNDVIKIYSDEETNTRVAALRGIDMNIEKGELISIIGPSGSGKSTLIRILAGIESVSSGEVIIGDSHLEVMNARELLKYRLKNVGIVHQFPERTLFLSGTISDNMIFSSSISSKNHTENKKRIKTILESLGIDHLENRRIRYLSGGEMIRAAIASALAKNVPILLADEPTGQLDSINTERVKLLLKQITRDFGVTVLVVTHDPRFQEGVDKTCEIKDGRVSALVRVIDGQIHKTHEYPLEFYSHIDSTNSVRIPTDIYKALQLGTDIKFIVSEDSKVELKHPNDLQPKKMDVIKIAKQKRLDIQPLSNNYFADKESEINFVDVSKIYNQKISEVIAVSDINMEIKKGELVFIIGPSGSGKTTLIKLITGLEACSNGEILVNNERLDKMNDAQRARFRRRNFGIVSQQGDLHPTITIRKNMFLKEILEGNFINLNKYPSEKMNQIFSMFEIDHRKDSFPLEISGGELQRASLAIANFDNPEILVLDEPTANMDAELAKNVMSQLFDLHEQLGLTFLIATHDINIIKDGSRVIELLDGKIKRDGFGYIIEK